MSKCLYCYKDISDNTDYHESCSKKFFGSRTAPQIEFSYSQISDLAKNVVERSVSVPGVQAKLSITLINKLKQKSDSRLTVVDALGGNYIFKPPNEKYPDMPENEHLTMRMAEVFGIRVVPSSLIRLNSGELSYITKRIDRTADGAKIHMIDMFQITEAFDKYKSSMERVGKVINNYSSNTLLDKLYFFEISIFSFVTGNNDMHLKNFSMIKTENGWELSPAYDLLNATIINAEDKEELALTMDGKKTKIKRQNFEKLAEDLDLSKKQINSTFKRFAKNKQKALDLIKISFLSDEMKIKYSDLLESRYDKILN